MKFAIITDEHYPYQDEFARNLAKNIVCEFKPDLMTVGSDGVDFYNISSFDKNPENFKTGLQVEIDAWKVGQREWRDCAPHAKRKFIIGNHEDRLRKFLWKHPEISGLEALELQNLLGLSSLGIEYAGQEVLVDDLLSIKHGSIIRKFSAMSAKAEVENERFAISTLSGHSHRGGVFYGRTRNGIVQGAECFCLCKLDPEYVKDPDWQQGIVLGETINGILSIEAVPFHGFGRLKRAIWRGKEYFN